MIRLVPLYGVGDCYLICALARAFERTHGKSVVIGTKATHGAIPEMFGLPWQACDGEVGRAESSREMQATWHNVIADGATIYVHPHFVRSEPRLDQLTVKPRVSQADMYRALLHISPWEPMEKPNIEPEPVAEVVFLSRSNSWPALPAEFWMALEHRLAGTAPILINNEKNSLRDLFRFGAGAKWIVGPQCGAISAFCEMGISARKTIIIRELGPDCPYLFDLTETLPYGHCSTFAGNDHADVDHIIVPASGWEAAIERILATP